MVHEVSVDQRTVSHLHLSMSWLGVLAHLWIGQRGVFHLAKSVVVLGLNASAHRVPVVVLGRVDDGACE